METNLLTREIFNARKPIHAFDSINCEIFALLIIEGNKNVIKFIEKNSKKIIYKNLLTGSNTEPYIRIDKNNKKLFYVDECDLKFIDLDNFNIYLISKNIISFFYNQKFNIIILLYKNKILEIRNPSSLDILYSIEIQSQIENYKKTKVSYDEDNQRIFFVESNKLIEIKIKNGTVYEHEIQTKEATWIDIGENSKLLGIIGNNLKGIFFYDTGNMAPINVKGLDASSVGYTRLKFIENSSNFILTSWIGFLSIIDINTGSTKFSRRVHDARIRDLLYLESTIYTCGDDGKILEHLSENI